MQQDFKFYIALRYHRQFHRLHRENVMSSTVVPCLRYRGAAIVQEIDDAPQGGPQFSCRDPEGHVWLVGSYDPWQATG